MRQGDLIPEVIRHTERLGYEQPDGWVRLGSIAARMGESPIRVAALLASAAASGRLERQERQGDSSLGPIVHYRAPIIVYATDVALATLWVAKAAKDLGLHDGWATARVVARVARTRRSMAWVAAALDAATAVGLLEVDTELADDPGNPLDLGRLYRSSARPVGQADHPDQSGRPLGQLRSPIRATVGPDLEEADGGPELTSGGTSIEEVAADLLRLLEGANGSMTTAQILSAASWGAAEAGRSRLRRAFKRLHHAGLARKRRVKGVNHYKAAR